MSLSSRLRPTLLAGLLLGAGLVLGGCSFSPVYSGAVASQPLLNLAYAKPSSRLEQIVYQELSLRFGSSTAPTAPLALVTASASVANVTTTATANPNTSSEVTVTTTLVITPRDGSDTKPVNFTRSATATYTTRGQVLSDNSAAEEAAERAARSAAESLRLAVLASFSR